jgi:amidase
MERRQFMQRAAAIAAGAVTAARHAHAQPASASPGLEDPALDQLRRAMAAGERTARSVVELYLERIATLDRSGPRLNSVIEINPDALDIADALDRERRAGVVRGPLHGVPVLIKDNIATADRMQTTAGSLALVDARPSRDAFIVERLRASGAVLLGKANLSEWANFRSSKSTSGWSSRGGLTRNPYALDRNACGSSSGSAVAVAANLCAVAIGTETDGSIICPSTRNGIVGIKPTVGLLSRSGIIPISETQDTAGPMARTVADAALLLGALTGVDGADGATRAGSGRALTDYTPFLKPDALSGARIGVMRNYFGFDARVDAIVEEAIRAMAAAGAHIVDPANLPTRGQFNAAEFEVMLYEFKAGIDAYLGGLGPASAMQTLGDLIAFNEAHAREVMPYFRQELFLRAQEKGPLTDRAYRDAKDKARRLTRDEGLDLVFRRHRIDALVAPSGGTAWLTDLVNGDSGTGGSSGPAAVSGYPSITVPAGFIHGLPVGVSFIGPAWSEGRLIGLAHAYEQSTQARRAPAFLPTAAV